jgi:hypothetical protein
MAREKNPEAAPATKRAARKRGSASDTGSAAVRPNFVDPQQRAALIGRAAYFRAMQRGFEPGHEVSDWLAAEVEVDAELLRGTVESSSA